MLVRTLLMFSLVAFASTVACAQLPGRGGMGGGPDRGRGAQRPQTERGAPAVSPGATTQAQLDSIEDDLKLTPAQRPAWNAYADRVQKLADEMSRLRFEARTGRVEGATAVTQLEQLANEERNRMTALDEIVALSRTLYAALTPEQKSLADRRLAPVVMALATGIYRAPVNPGKS